MIIIKTGANGKVNIEIFLTINILKQLQDNAYMGKMYASFLPKEGKTMCLGVDDGNKTKRYVSYRNFWYTRWR